MNSKALSIKPPLHPLFPYLDEQSTSYYSEYLSNLPIPVRTTAGSKDPIAEKAQHEPH